MVGRYEIGQGTGYVTVTREGLYYRFSCRCHLTGDVMHHLVVETESGNADLGVCVPMEGQFGTEKRIACKLLGENPKFYLLPKHEQMTGRFVPVYPEEPFAYMTRLKDAFLAERSGQLGIVIR